jgi:hypothetical protein
MNRWVAVGSNERLGYCFPLPITMQFWKDRIGYEPIAILTEDPGYWKATAVRRLVVEECKKQGRVEWAGHHPRFQSGTISQSARFHVAALDLPGDDVLIPGDADLWPLSREFYYQHDPDFKAIGSYYANGYNNRTHLPSCHISMRVSKWREVLDIDPADSIYEALVKTFERGKLAELKDMAVWYFDEHYLTKKIFEYTPDESELQRIDRVGHPPKDRIDRGGEDNRWWPAEPNITGMVDAHLPRPPFADEVWPSLGMIIRQAFGMDAMMEWHKYRERFVEAMR